MYEESNCNNSGYESSFQSTDLKTEVVIIVNKCARWIVRNLLTFRHKEKGRACMLMYKFCDVVAGNLR